MWPRCAGAHRMASFEAGKASSKETTRMTIFPTRILLATDGSREAELAARTAADLAKSHDSDLHVVYVEPALPMIDQFADTGPERTSPESRRLVGEQGKRGGKGGGAVAGGA